MYDPSNWSRAGGAPSLSVARDLPPPPPPRYGSCAPEQDAAVVARGRENGVAVVEANVGLPPGATRQSLKAGFDLACPRSRAAFGNSSKTYFLKREKGNFTHFGSVGSRVQLGRYPNPHSTRLFVCLCRVFVCRVFVLFCF